MKGRIAKPGNSNEPGTVIKNRKRQDLQFEDLRPEAIQMKQLKTQIQSSVSSAPIIQRKVPTVVTKSSPKMVKLEAVGTVNDFKNGESAGKDGWNGVTKYMASCNIDGFDTISVGPLDNDYRMAHAGHVLAQQNGGMGDEDNIFAQDGGVNTTGAWIQFENEVRKTLDNEDNNGSDDVSFSMAFVGKDGLSQGKLDRDHMPDTEFTDSQKDFFDL